MDKAARATDSRAETGSDPDAPAERDEAARGNAPPVLGGIGPQDLVAGRPWRLHVRARDPDGDAPRLLVRDLPDGARLSDEGRGWHRLDWTPPVGTGGEIDLTFVAVDARDARIRSGRVVRLVVRDVRSASRPDPDPVPGFEPPATSPAPAEPPAAAEELSEELSEEFWAELWSGLREELREAPPEPRPRAPIIAPLASQIVSAGRTVAFRVAATLEEPDRAPSLQIDRLPRHASFDANADGSRTFYWPTGDADQGEHRFRITASHPDDKVLRSRVDLLVIVGDPTRSVTVPFDEADPGIATPSAERSGDPSPDASPSPDPDDPISSDDEPFLPRAGSEEPDYWESDDELGPDGFPIDPYAEYAEEPLAEPDDPFFETEEPGYFDDDDGLPLGPDGQPFEP